MSFETFINIFCRRFLFIGFFFIEFKELFISFDIFYFFLTFFSLKHIQRYIFTFFARFYIIHSTFHSVQSLFQFFFLVENYITSNHPTYFHFFSYFVIVVLVGINFTIHIYMIHINVKKRNCFICASDYWELPKMYIFTYAIKHLPPINKFISFLSQITYTTQ